jgi:hypothetical protein
MIKQNNSIKREFLKAVIARDRVKVDELASKLNYKFRPEDWPFVRIREIMESGGDLSGLVDRKTGHLILSHLSTEELKEIIDSYPEENTLTVSVK